MKLHKDGTVEGTPEEITEYNRLATSRGVVDREWTNDIMRMQREILELKWDELSRQAVAAVAKDQREDIERQANEIRSRLQALDEQHAIESVYEKTKNSE